MKVLVTGGAGYIGSVTVERLLDAGHEVVVFDNLERGHRKAVDPRAAFRKGDLRDRERIRAVLREVRPNGVMHFAAYALVPESMQAPERYFGNNVVGGLHLADAMLEVGVPRLVFSSTCAVYGIPQEVPIPEEAPTCPANPYGESKRMLEVSLDWYHRRRGLQTVFLRYFNACGATERYGEDHDPETHLIPNVLRAAQTGKPVALYGTDYDTPDGTCVRDYIHVEDLAEAHILALMSRHSGPFNLGTGQGFSVREVIAVAREVTGRPIRTRVAPRRPGDPPRLIASSEKARRLLGWQPRRTELANMIRSAWIWLQAHPRGYAS